jgi:phosphoribosyl 1,2-cyclic phosphate phosphodiesterase
VDTSAEFRLRCLEYSIKRIDAILLTHAHADHIAGLDDIRIYNDTQSIEKTQEGGGKPRVIIGEITHFRDFKAAGFDITPVPLKHGELTITGFIIDKSFAYLTDCSEIPEETYARLKGLDTVVLDALRLTPHPTHFSLEQAVEAADRIGAGKTYFTHIAHAIEHEKIEAGLPAGMKIAYDGLEILLK